MTNLLFASVFGNHKTHILHPITDAIATQTPTSVHGWITSKQQTQLRSIAQDNNCDSVIQSIHQARTSIRLLAMDFDSTLVTSEGLDMLAESYKVGDQVAALTQKAMRGELDFHASITQRLQTLAGMHTTQIDALATHQPIQPGMQELIEYAHAHGIVCAIISGGFEQLITPLATQLGITHVVCNRFATTDGRLNGAYTGPLIDAQGKKNALLALCDNLNLKPEQALALGDGANDIPMLQAAGLGIALHPKPKVFAANPNALHYNTANCLTALLTPHHPPEARPCI